MLFNKVHSMNCKYLKNPTVYLEYITPISLSLLVLSAANMITGTVIETYRNKISY